VIYNIDIMDFLKGRQGAPEFDMMFADPPFNIGQKYHGFHDQMVGYPLWLAQWVNSAWQLLKPGGVMVLHGSSSVTTSHLQPLAQNLKDGTIEAEVIWHFEFSQNRDTNWQDSFTRALVVRKDGEPAIWQPDANLVKSARLKAGDKRTETAKRKGWIVPHNVWHGEGFPRIQGNHSERWDIKHGALVDHPNQLPQLYCARFVKAYTRPAGRVLDLFCGSGTMPLVCRKLRRDCDSVELVKLTARSARKRMREGFISKGW